MYSSFVSEMWIAGGKGNVGRHVKKGQGEIGLSLAREMLEFVDEVRGWVESMGYRKEEYTLLR
jgi:hypothetical protein